MEGKAGSAGRNRGKYSVFSVQFRGAKREAHGVTCLTEGLTQFRNPVIFEIDRRLAAGRIVHVQQKENLLVG